MAQIRLLRACESTDDGLDEWLRYVSEGTVGATARTTFSLMRSVRDGKVLTFLMSRSAGS